MLHRVEHVNFSITLAYTYSLSYLYHSPAQLIVCSLLVKIWSRTRNHPNGLVSLIPFIWLVFLDQKPSHPMFMERCLILPNVYFHSTATLILWLIIKLPTSPMNDMNLVPFNTSVCTWASSALSFLINRCSVNISNISTWNFWPYTDCCISEHQLMGCKRSDSLNRSNV